MSRDKVIVCVGGDCTSCFFFCLGCFLFSSMGFPSKLFVEQPGKSLFCEVCKDVFEDPVTIDACEDVFCRKCFGTTDNSTPMPCPVCEKVTICPEDLEPAPRAVRNVLHELKVRCFLSGCGEEMLLEQFISHRRSCQTTLVSCPRNCEGTLLKAELEDHDCMRHWRRVASVRKTKIEALEEKNTKLQTELNKERAVKTEKIAECNLSLKQIVTMEKLIKELEGLLKASEDEIRKLEASVERFDKEYAEAKDDMKKTVSSIIERFDSKFDKVADTLHRKHLIADVKLRFHKTEVREMEIEKEYFSTVQGPLNLPWCLSVRKKRYMYQEFLAVYLYCKDPNPSFRHRAESTITLLKADNIFTEGELASYKLHPQVFHVTGNGWGNPLLCTWKKLMEEGVKDNAFTVEAVVRLLGYSTSTMQ